MNEIKKFETNVYVIRHRGLVVYVGKGTAGAGNRWLSKKNEWFNKFDEDLNFERSIEKVFRHTDKRKSDEIAETFESKLIRKYKPIFNLNEGRTPRKYVEGEELTLEDMVDSLIENTQGHGILEPLSIAKKMLTGKSINYDKRDILILGNRGYAGINIINETYKLNPNANLTFVTTGDLGLVITKLSDNVKSKGIKVINMPIQDYTATTKDNFDYIIGNPPYQKMVGSNGKSESIWAEITSRLFGKLKEDGSMTMIHPSGWRMLKGRSKKSLKLVNELYTNHEIVDMSFNSYKKGLETFGVMTDFDIITVRKTPIKDGEPNIVKIHTESDGDVELDIKGKLVIPTDKLELFKKLTSNKEKVEILYSSSAYETRKKWMSKNENGEFKYPVLYNSGRKKGDYFIFSNTKDNGHFGVPKLIIPRAGYNVVEDYNGDYGIAQFAIGIVDTVENLKKIKKALDTPEFRELSTHFIGDTNKLALMDTNGAFEKFIYQFDKDFWKVFI